mmetsp:Transcript_29367/g.58269  ORF Transcript_29367/g.58269 Transcript_29367/m.58269 type:complete len:80 (+) Transcript_29367:185-424(+)
MNSNGTIMVNIKEAIPIWMWHVLDGAGTTENPGTFGAVSMGNPHCIVFVDDLKGCGLQRGRPRTRRRDQGVDMCGSNDP